MQGSKGLQPRMRLSVKPVWKGESKKKKKREWGRLQHKAVLRKAKEGHSHTAPVPALQRSVFKQIHPGKVGTMPIALGPTCPMLRGRHGRTPRQRWHPLARGKAPISGMLQLRGMNGRFRTWAQRQVFLFSSPFSDCIFFGGIT